MDFQIEFVLNNNKSTDLFELHYIHLSIKVSNVIKNRMVRYTVNY